VQNWRSILLYTSDIRGFTMKLNHVANRVTQGSLDLILELFTTQLGFKLLRRIPTDIWLRQPGASIDIQFCETASPLAEGDKHNSHISFLSETPEADLRRLAAWFEARGMKTKIGSWSAKEFYLDVPEVFVDFSIESMLPELAEYGV
jgi:hypothetical protein